MNQPILKAAIVVFAVINNRRSYVESWFTRDKDGKHQPYYHTDITEAYQFESIPIADDFINRINNSFDREFFIQTAMLPVKQPKTHVNDETIF